MVRAPVAQTDWCVQVAAIISALAQEAAITSALV